MGRKSYIVIAIGSRSLDHPEEPKPFNETLAGLTIEEVEKAFFRQRYRQDFTILAIIREDDRRLVREIINSFCC